MSKTKTLFTVALLVLLGSMGAAQAENTFYEIKLFTTPMDFAREGGTNEASGDILLNFDPMPEDVLTATIEYSVPLAGDIDEPNATSMTSPSTSINSVMVGEAEDEDNNGNGTVTITDFDSAEVNLLIRGVMLDVSNASGPVTVTVTVKSSDSTDFVRIDGQNTAMVIGDIKVGVVASAKPKTVRTRGTSGDGITAEMTIKESFPGAFMTGNVVTVDFSGIPEGAMLNAMVMNNPVAGVDAEDALDAMDSHAAVNVKDGSATVTLGIMSETPDNNRVAPKSVVLGVTLIVDPEMDDTEVSFPLDRGSIMAEATFTGDDFDDADSDQVVVFNIRPAQCELLFPVVTVLGAWDTAISVTNPAYGDEMAAGGLTFTFYGIGSPPVMYVTTEDMITGIGLEEDDGTLAPGGTYQVMSSQILAATDWGETFQGHVHLTADYTNCNGSGWVTDFMGVSNSYTATVIDHDTGDEN